MPDDIGDASPIQECMSSPSTPDRAGETSPLPSEYDGITVPTHDSYDECGDFGAYTSPHSEGSPRLEGAETPWLELEHDQDSGPEAEDTPVFDEDADTVPTPDDADTVPTP